MSGKKFKILNRKLNSLLQVQADAGSWNNVSGIEVDVMLKAQEFRLRTIMGHIETKHEERLKRQSDSYNHDVKSLKAIAKERHILFIEVVKKVKEDVNFKIEEICQYMTKEVANLDLNYSNLHTKVDIIVDVVMKVVEYYNSLHTKVGTKSETDSKGFVKLEELLGGLKESFSTLKVSPLSSISQESLSKLFYSFEYSLKDQLAIGEFNAF